MCEGLQAGGTGGEGPVAEPAPGDENGVTRISVRIGVASVTDPSKFMMSAVTA
jgi:hypothetical protein